MSDTAPGLGKMVSCPHCDGKGYTGHASGGGPAQVTELDHPPEAYDPYMSWIEKCSTCEGSGRITIDLAAWLRKVRRELKEILDRMT